MLVLCTLGWTQLFAEVSSEIDAANFLAEKNIIVDRSDTPDLYELDSNIQRQAVMKVVMKLSGVDVPDTCRGEFSDVDTDDWPCKYIESALDAGFIAANDRFRPFDNITKTEAMKLVLKSKRIEKIQNTSAWQDDYMQTALEYRIIDEAYYDFNANATRGWIFKIATAAIQKQAETIQQWEIISDEAQL